MQATLDLLQLTAQRFQQKLNVFAQIDKKPELILTDLYDGETPHDWFDYMLASNNAMTVPAKTKGKMKKVKPLVKQQELHDKLFPLVKAYLEAQDAEITVVHNQANKMILNIIYRGYRILNVSFYSHTFRDAHSDDLDNVRYNLETLERSIADTQRRVATYEQMIADPDGYRKQNPAYSSRYRRDHIELEIRKAPETLARNKAELEKYLMKKVMLEKTRDQFAADQGDLEQKAALWKQFFLNLGYAEGMDSSLSNVGWGWWR